MTSASTTTLIDRLTARALITRQGDPSDRRRTLLAVTDQARQLGEAFFGPLITRVVTTLDDGFDVDERAILRRFLGSLAVSVRQSSPGDGLGERDAAALSINLASSRPQSL